MVLPKFSYMLKKNKYQHIQAYVSNCADDKEINLLILGLFYFSKKQYSKAIELLNEYKLAEYSFLKYQLIADWKYEFLSNKREYENVINDYQVALDIAKNEISKAVINNRIKHIKYR